MIEDVQWADDATLDLLKVVGRRIDQLPALVVVTIRDEDVGPDHRLSTTLGDIPPASMVSVPLPPLSVSAVRQLASGTDIDPAALHAAAGGNPFFVAEVVASGRGRTAADGARCGVGPGPALAGGFAGGAPRGRRPRAGVCSVDVALPGGRPAPRSSGRMCRAGNASAARLRGRVSSRAGAARRPRSRHRVEPHPAACTSVGRALRAPWHVEPSELAHHALEAGDVDAVLELAPRAGAEAARLSAASRRARALRPRRALCLTAHADRPGAPADRACVRVLRGRGRRSSRLVPTRGR